MRVVGTVGEWKFQHHRMARFEDGKLFSHVSSLDDEGTRWQWTVMLPGRGPSERTKGEAGSALEAVHAADAVATGLVPAPADDDEVEDWAAKHLTWRAEADATETESTQLWSGD